MQRGVRFGAGPDWKQSVQSAKGRPWHAQRHCEWDKVWKADSFCSLALGSSMSKDCSLETEIQSSIEKAATTFSRLSFRAWRNTHFVVHQRQYVQGLHAKYSVLQLRNIANIYAARKQTQKFSHITMQPQYLWRRVDEQDHKRGHFATPA